MTTRLSVEEREICAALHAIEMMGAQVEADSRLLRETRERLDRNADTLSRIRADLRDRLSAIRPRRRTV